MLTAAWPTPPLPFILKRLTPLPNGTVIADLGCGDATLARTLVPEGKLVLSFDLVSDSIDGQEDHGGWVVETDFLDRIPLPGRPGGSEVEDGGDDSDEGSAGPEIVDVVVCCLSLMGTNWIEGIYEACRIMKRG